MRILVASHTYIVALNCEKLRWMATLDPTVEVVAVVPRRWRPGGVQAHTLTPQPWQADNFRVIPVANCNRHHQGLLTFGAELVPLLRRWRPDIIQVEQGAKALAYAQFITLNRWLNLKAKTVFFTWWNLPYSLRFPAAWIEAYNLRHTDGAIAGNQDGATVLRQRGYQGPLRVMPQLGVDEQRFRPNPEPALAQTLGLTPQDFVIGFVGRFVAEKGLLTLCQALIGLKSLAWTWLLVGRGPLRAAVTEAAHAGDIGDRLRWVEAVPHAEVPRYLNLMQVLVLPSQTAPQFKTLTTTGWKEQFGHVLIEAMACQVPVIGSDSGEIPQVIGTAGLLFPEGNVETLRDRLRTVMQQPALRADLAQRGYQRVMAHYTNRRLAQQQLAFYHTLLDP